MEPKPCFWILAISTQSSSQVLVPVFTVYSSAAKRQVSCSECQQVCLGFWHTFLSQVHTFPWEPGLVSVNKTSCLVGWECYFKSALNLPEIPLWLTAELGQTKSVPLRHSYLAYDRQPLLPPHPMARSGVCPLASSLVIFSTQIFSFVLGIFRPNSSLLSGLLYREWYLGWGLIYLHSCFSSHTGPMRWVFSLAFY